MKKTMKLAVISTLVAIGIATANAQDTNATTATNIVLNINIALTGFSQSDSNATAVRLSNKEIFSAFNAGGGGTVGKSAKIIAVTTADNSGGPTFFIREKNGTSVTDTPINLTVSQTDEIVGKNGVRYSIITLTFDNGAGTDFSVSGFATRREGRTSGRGIGNITGITTGLTASVAGTGHIDGNPAVLRGNVNASGAKPEVVDIVP
jgi:hypothetical protein